MLSKLSFYEKQWDYYKPDQWIPHCTMTINISNSKLLKAIKFLKEEFKPQKLTLEDMYIVEHKKNEKINIFDNKEIRT